MSRISGAIQPKQDPLIVASRYRIQVAEQGSLLATVTGGTMPRAVRLRFFPEDFCKARLQASARNWFHCFSRRHSAAKSMPRNFEARGELVLNLNNCAVMAVSQAGFPWIADNASYYRCFPRPDDCVLLGVRLQSLLMNDFFDFVKQGLGRGAS
ncbi:protein of unknown function [Cupriavidus taiwanensis]|uniref:Uncharacterized protein n=1 Tax=Cupriavidus taiwanensis TaxID=164546 RepID=A0A9Q7XSZ4_9BURK|nr:protein of unknown function [Cupriavidus taiwanensis]